METQNLELGEETSARYNQFSIINTIVLIFIVIITGFHHVVTLSNYHYLFSWHVIVGSMAYLLLAPISMIILNKPFLNGYSSKKKHKIHGIVICIATILAIISVVIDFIRKEVYKPQYPTITHFESSHAITGLISVVLYVISNFTGLFAHNISWLKGKIRPIILQISHNLLGQLAYIIGMISIIVIFFTPWYKYYHTLTGMIIMTILLIFVSIFTIIKPSQRLYDLIKNLF